MGMPYDSESQAAGLARRGLRFEQPTHKDCTADVTLTQHSPGMLHLDATAGVFTVYLPAEVYEGLRFDFSEVAGLATAVTIDGNGKNINGVASLVMNAPYRQRTVRYSGTQWIVTGGIG